VSRVVCDQSLLENIYLGGLAATPISACLCRGSRDCFRGECCTGGESMACSTTLQYPEAFQAIWRDCKQHVCVEPLNGSKFFHVKVFAVAEFGTIPLRLQQNVFIFNWSNTAWMDTV